MKKKFLVSALGFPIILFMGSGGTILSSGAPIGATNAPGESSCARTGCHTGNNNVNTGAGLLSVSSLQDINNYTPGTVYDITVTLDEPGVQRFGYSLTALDEQNRKTGSFIVTDAARTQIFKGAQQFADREYMTYRMIGTDPYQPGKGQWFFKWEAPAQNVGKITFYVAAVSANNDATDKGDLVYTNTLVSGDALAGIRTSPAYKDGFSIFPNPAKSHLNIRTDHAITEPVTLILLDAAGKKITETTTVVSGNTIRLPLSSFLPGIYYVKLQGNSVSGTQKFLLIN